jgi:hypothetical protein
LIQTLFISIGTVISAESFDIFRQAAVVTSTNL